jgi:hypothetical protein
MVAVSRPLWAVQLPRVAVEPGARRAKNGILDGNRRSDAHA